MLMSVADCLPAWPGLLLLLLLLPPSLAGLYKAKDWDDAIDKARTLVEFGGHGHTSCLYTRPTNKEHIKVFRDVMETVRILINSPASQG
jgi:acetaldehyde dehydrogenase/alcohol dehydrogenase